MKISLAIALSFLALALIPGCVQRPTVYEAASDLTEALCVRLEQCGSPERAQVCKARTLDAVEPSKDDLSTCSEDEIADCVSDTQAMSCGAILDSKMPDCWNDC